jgi:hypothetical protein
VPGSGLTHNLPDHLNPLWEPNSRFQKKDLEPQADTQIGLAFSWSEQKVDEPEPFEVFMQSLKALTSEAWPRPFNLTLVPSHGGNPLFETLSDILRFPMP